MRLSVCLLLLAATPLLAQKPEQKSTFGGSYSTLRPEQQRLVGELIARYNRLANAKLDPAAAYDDSRLSVRTTFDAVSHALLTTRLTRDNGEPMGNALDLVDVLEEIAGEVPKAPGDRQFRIYVIMRPGALDKLEAAREFRRGADNTVFHKGYPVCYRLQGGVPSIQISLTRDGSRADIDVDYRSSKIPVGLFNGHLKSDNSDIRAGNNVERHSNRWSGLEAWWRSLFGWGGPEAVQETGSAAEQRSLVKAGIDATVDDFLKAWLVEKDVGRAASYFSRQSLRCVERDALARGRKLEPGTARAHVKLSLKKFADALPPGTKLGDLVAGIPPLAPPFREVKNEFSSYFLVGEVPSRFAAAYGECSTGEAEVAPGKDRYSGDYLTAFSLRRDGKIFATIYLLWSKDAGSFKINSTRVDDGDAPPLVSLRESAPAEPQPELPVIDGDPAAVAAIQDFFEQWLARRRYPQAAAYISTRAAACTDPPGRRMTDVLRDGAVAMGAPRPLAELLEAVEPYHPQILRVRHAQEAIWSIVAVPNHLAEAFFCGERATRMPKDPASPIHGNYYAATLRFKIPASEGGVFRLLWGKEGAAWKLMAWEFDSP